MGYSPVVDAALLRVIKQLLRSLPESFRKRPFLLRLGRPVALLWPLCKPGHSCFLWLVAPPAAPGAVASPFPLRNSLRSIAGHSLRDSIAGYASPMLRPLTSKCNLFKRPHNTGTDSVTKWSVLPIHVTKTLCYTHGHGIKLHQLQLALLLQSLEGQWHRLDTAHSVPNFTSGSCRVFRIGA